MPDHIGVTHRGNFAGRLEQAARGLGCGVERTPGTFSIAALIQQDVALTMEQIDGLRTLHRSQLRSLLRAECYINTELMDMEERTPRYSPDRFPERDKLQQRLFVVESDRRRQFAFYHERLQALQSRLLSLLQKHGQVHVAEGGVKHHMGRRKHRSA